MDLFFCRIFTTQQNASFGPLENAEKASAYNYEPVNAILFWVHISCFTTAVRLHFENCSSVMSQCCSSKEYLRRGVERRTHTRHFLGLKNFIILPRTKLPISTPTRRG